MQLKKADYERYWLNWVS